MQDQLFEEISELHGLQVRRFPEDEFLRELKARFPTDTFGIRWDRVPNYVHGAEGTRLAEGDAARLYLSQFVQAVRLNDETDLLWWGDLFMDTACVMTVSEIRKCIPTIVEYPHNVLFVTPDFAWCMTWYSEGHFAYGRSPLWHDPRHLMKPIGRVVVLDWYDGPIAGVGECGVCGRPFRFEPLAWDGNHDIRIYSIASLPGGSFERIDAVLRSGGEATRPIWVPRAPDADDSIDREKAVLDHILGSASPPSSVIASRDMQSVLAVREIEPNSIDEVADWFSFLGLPNKQAGYMPFPRE